MSGLRRGGDGERGQVLVIVAGGATALLLLMGLVLDGGVAFFNRRSAQNDSDVMAVTGAKFLADKHQGRSTIDANVFAALTRNATENGCSGSGGVPCDWHAWFVKGGGSGPVDDGQVTPGVGVPDDALGVRVAVHRQPRTFVVGLAGLTSWNIVTQATATAEVSPVAPANSVLPIAVMDDGVDLAAYPIGQEISLTEGKDIPGGFSYISWGPSGGAALASAICAPSNPPFAMGSAHPGNPDKSTIGAVRACIQGWIDSKKQVLLPIYGSVTRSGSNADYTITGVAAFVITSQGQPAVDNIQGYFVGTYDINPAPGGSDSRVPTADDTSVYLGLVR